MAEIFKVIVWLTMAMLKYVNLSYKDYINTPCHLERPHS